MDDKTKDIIKNGGTIVVADTDSVIPPLGDNVAVIRVDGPPKAGMASISSSSSREPRTRRVGGMASMAGLAGLLAGAVPTFGLSVRHVRPKRLQCGWCGRLQRKDDPEAKGWQASEPVLCPNCLKLGVPGSRVKPVFEPQGGDHENDDTAGAADAAGVCPHEVEAGSDGPGGGE